MLSELGGAVRIPTYDRRSLTRSVVHIGVGGFHRAHQAVYFDELAQRGISTDWGVVGVGLRNRQIKDALDPQDCLFTVVERDNDGDSPRVVGSLCEVQFAPDDPEAVVRLLSRPTTRLVTLTITGDGYNVDLQTGAFDADADGIERDVENLGRPATASALLVAALRRRRRKGIAPFTVLSCDNVPRNGAVARESVVGFARLVDEELADWIDEHVAFPSSMVDRITPTTTDGDRRLLLEEHGIHDRWPVMTEPFSQWIVEDDFCNARPPLEEVGVQFVPDVAPYQLTKTRLLNAGHSALGYLGSLAGHERTDEAMNDQALKLFLADFMSHDVAPLLPDAPGIEIPSYKRTLLRRFANPKIGDPLARLCGRGSTKMPSYLLPSIVEAASQGRPHPRLTVAVAAWFRYLRGTDCVGREVEVRDALKDELQPLARMGGTDPRPLLSRRNLFGDLSQNEPFVKSVERALVSLDYGGVTPTVTAELTAEIERAA